MAGILTGIILASILFGCDDGNEFGISSQEVNVSPGPDGPCEVVMCGELPDPEICGDPNLEANNSHVLEAYLGGHPGWIPFSYMWHVSPWSDIDHLASFADWLGLMPEDLKLDGNACGDWHDQIAMSSESFTPFFTIPHQENVEVVLGSDELVHVAELWVWPNLLASASIQAAIASVPAAC